MDFLISLISTRGGQLVARYASKGILMLATYLQMSLPEDSANKTAEVVGSFAVAGVLMIIDHFSHAKQAAAATSAETK